ncbi:hypothetical protein JXA32_14955 [Candidatus Sumerlaeota bacterium]|nr:hypothetical protein [Candidatus Sumerlaeota bacterium]
MSRNEWMPLIRIWAVMTALVAMAGLTGCARPGRALLTHKEYPSKSKSAPIDVYIGRYPGERIPLAVVNSVSLPEKDTIAKANMVENLRKQARKLGGDAVEDIRLLPREVRSYVTDENTPFRSWRQGTSYTYLLRGTVIRYDGEIVDVDQPRDYFRFKPPKNPNERESAQLDWTASIPEEPADAPESDAKQTEVPNERSMEDAN